ncbi:hypothetical protein [Lysobacter enzymogenes]|uniref:hypothetical protein n=1 Tax=Lysobacter enzymogenes TaxID=69 RepID=UPI001AF720FA|nr:hypothetical protein [Lysobacter enzymogenes]QQP99508.1 hypothetical protein JHW41_15430 [Lysobacter enzymogenes]
MPTAAAHEFKGTMPVKFFAVLAACLLLSACANAPAVRERADASPCLPDSRQCAIYDFAMADERVLRANGEAVAVDCPWSAGEASLEQRRAHCAELIEVALAVVADRLPDALQRIPVDQVRYEDVGACVDGVARERAGGDCYRRLRAKVPLPWIVPSTGAAAAGSGLR